MRAAAVVAARVIPGHIEADGQGHDETRCRDRQAEDVADHAGIETRQQEAQPGDGHEIRQEQHRYPAQVAQEMAADIGGGPALETKAQGKMLGIERQGGDGRFMPAVARQFGGRRHGGRVATGDRRDPARELQPTDVLTCGARCHPRPPDVLRR